MIKGKSIDDFKAGDVVTRVEPVYRGTKDNLVEDNGFMGEPLILKSNFGINYIVLNRAKKKLGLFEDREVVLEDNTYNFGWDYYFPEKSAVNDLTNKFEQRNPIN